MTPYIVGGAIIIAALLIFAATSNRLKCRTYFFKSNKVSKEITVVHISDLHECSFGKKQEKLLDMIKGASPDIIVITGDTFEDDEKTVGQLKSLNPARLFLKGAVKIAPCYMVLGNHERFIKSIDELCLLVEGMGIHLLHPTDGEGAVQYKEVRISDFELTVCGVPDPYFFYEAKNRKGRSIKEIFAEDKDRKNTNIKNWRDKIESELPSIYDENALMILLSHRPEEYEFYEKLGFDLVFSGHAHGGQWRLPPFINGVYAPHQGVFPDHAGGVYPLGKGLHIVSRGLSKKRMFRIFNRPEVCVVKISKDFSH